MSTKPPVSAEQVAETFESLAPVADRVRLTGLDHARRVQAGRTGATERRLALTMARRGDDTALISALQQRLATEHRVDGAYTRAVTRAEIEVPERKAASAVIHGLVIPGGDLDRKGLTVAAVGADGAVERYTCTDARGYFRMDLAAQDGATVYLQVSDAGRAVLYRGDQAIALAPGAAVYREIRLSGDRLPPCPVPPERATMPRLLDLPESEALALLGRFGLAMGQRLTQTAPKRAGLVVSQEPAAGTPVTAQTKVTLVIGVEEGGATVSVPALKGLTLDGAKAKIEAAKLALGGVLDVPGEPAGAVLAQKPEAGAQVPPGTAVSLSVATGTQQEGVRVPALVGKQVKDAQSILKEAGLKTGNISFQDDPRAGVVLAQDPAAGQQVATGTPVALVAGRKADTEQVKTPNVVGQKLAEAQKTIEKARLKLGDVSGNRDGVVAGQTPAAGVAVPPGSAVSLRLATGTVRPVTPAGGAYADGLAHRVAADPGFATLDVSEAGVAASLRKAEVADAAGAQRVVAMDNETLARAFGMDNLNHARSLRRMLRDALARP